MQRVIDISADLAQFFKKTKNPRIIVNIGGFSSDSFVSNKRREKKYSIFTKSMSELDLKKCTILPQTMPPYPWHFGGQRFHNLFVYPDEIAKICEDIDLKICLDLSHLKLSCTEFNLDFTESLRMLAPYTSHIHVVDALGSNGEGLQIGDGEIDFTQVSKIFKKYYTNCSFIPEIWQGHKNEGEGFWIALNKLQEFSI